MEKTRVPPEIPTEPEITRVTNPLALYVGDLDPAVAEPDLAGAFAEHGPITSVRVCRTKPTPSSPKPRSLCYGYVNFTSTEKATEALEKLNHTTLRGRPMRIMWSQRDPIRRKTGDANLFVKNLDESIDGRVLEKTFGVYGKVLSCKVAVENGKSKGFGFVQFDTEEEAQAAIAGLNGSVIVGDKKLCVAEFAKKSLRTIQSHESKGFNLYIKNLDDDITSDFLKEKFSTYGEVNSAVVMKDVNGKSRGFGFVSFGLAVDAKQAMNLMNGSQLGTKHIFVGVALRKDEREKQLKEYYGENFKPRNVIPKNSNLYVKNLNSSIDDAKLNDIFKVCGTVISAKVMLSSYGLSRGFGFVCFSSSEEATRAISQFHGKFVLGRRIYVSIAQTREARMKHLQSTKRNYSFYNNRPKIISGSRRPFAGYQQTRANQEQAQVYYPYWAQNFPRHERFNCYTPSNRGTKSIYYPTDYYYWQGYGKQAESGG